MKNLNVRQKPARYFVQTKKSSKIKAKTLQNQGEKTSFAVRIAVSQAHEANTLSYFTIIIPPILATIVEIISVDFL